MSEAKRLEKNIFQIKLDLSRISEERWRAALSRNQSAVLNARMKAAEKTLENVSSLAAYVANFSAPLARQISQKEAEARRTFEESRKLQDLELFNKWVKEQLVPSTKFAEQLGHVAASASKLGESPTDFHRWAGK